MLVTFHHTLDLYMDSLPVVVLTGDAPTVTVKLQFKGTILHIYTVCDKERFEVTETALGHGVPPEMNRRHHTIFLLPR